MFTNDQSYLQHRAKIEAERAEQARCAKAAQVHHQLAVAYLDRLAAIEPGQKQHD